MDSVRACTFLALLVGAAAAGLRGPPATHLTVSEEDARKFQEVDALRKNVSWHRNKVPAHLKVPMLESIPVVQLGGCGKRIAAKQMGLKRGAESVRAWKDESFLQLVAPEHPGRNSLAKPGVGIEQVPADNGRSVIGQISGQEPYVTVLKDGFFEVGCYYDAMLHFADMYGKGKFKYNMASTNTSIALYSELVLKDEQQPMTPTLCFQFCRTVPGMVFFGISEGRNCYCAPFYKPEAGSAEQCDAVCEGDTTKMCGNTKGKSSIWEMHLCETIGQELAAATAAAKEALDFYFENSLLALDLGTKMMETGNALQETGGLSGGRKASSNGLAANKASKALTQAYQTGAKDYALLLGFYRDGKAVEAEDMSGAAAATKAQDATKYMKQMTPVVLGAAGSIHALVTDAYPPADKVVFGDEPDSADGVAVALAKGTEPNDFRIAPYALGDTTYEPAASSCTGPVIGLPKVGLGSDGCAVACENTLFPAKCVAFTSYTIDGFTDLCYLLSNVIDVETFECAEAALLETEKKEQAEAKKAAAVCKVKMSEISTGFQPKGKWDKYPRCFGSDKDFALATSVTELSLGSETEVKTGSTSAGIAKAE